MTQSLILTFYHFANCHFLFISQSVIAKQTATTKKEVNQAPTNINSNLLQQSPSTNTSGYGSAVGAGLNLTSADNKPYLWTVDKSPIYGSPNGMRRSPRPLTGYGQYSYTE